MKPADWLVLSEEYNCGIRSSCCLSLAANSILDIAGVQTIIKILCVTISDRLSVNQHVTNVIASCAQTFHALRVLRSYGLNKDALEGVFKAVVIDK